jgi:4'-phosphopantetheinyl transferase EntD
MGRDEPADAVRFPHPALSLSHSGDWAIAAGCAAADGLGVDLEFARPMDARAARFFLAGPELDYVGSLPPPQQGAELLRLWTVKEAVFKACADNRGRLLADFRLDEPAARAGTARRVDGSGFTARYGSIDLGEAWLAVALATSGAAA